MASLAEPSSQQKMPPPPPPPRPMSSELLQTELAKRGRPLRVFSGTWNVRGRPNVRVDGNFEHISAAAVLPWLRGAFDVASSGAPDFLFFSLQEVMDLSPVNVVVDSFQPSDDHFARVAIWRAAITEALQLVALSSKASSPSYQWLGQSTQVGLVLLVFGTREIRDSLLEIQIGNVKTGWGGYLGNKGTSG